MYIFAHFCIFQGLDRLEHFMLFLFYKYTFICKCVSFHNGFCIKYKDCTVNCEYRPFCKPQGAIKRKGWRKRKYKERSKENVKK